MKKLLTIMLALVMSLSIANIFTACEEQSIQEQPQAPEHNHTYATEWATDDDYHWHKATCEHSEEIVDKAEHTYGDDGNCTVCKMKKPPVTTVTEEQWAYELDLETNKTNRKAIFEQITNLETQKAYFETDGENTHTIIDINNSYNEDIYIKTDINYDHYKREGRNVEFTKSPSNNPDPSGFRALFDFGTYIKNKFSDAEYDKTTNTYIINYENLTIDTRELRNAKYIISFKDGVLKNIQLTAEAFEGTVIFNIEFEFDIVSIKAPQV